MEESSLSNQTWVEISALCLSSYNLKQITEPEFQLPPLKNGDDNVFLTG